MAENKEIQEKFEALAQENEALKQENAEQKETIASKEKAIAEQAAVMTKMMGTVIETAQAEKPKVPEKAVSFNKKQYKFTLAQFIMPGRGKMLAEDAMTDKDIIAEIIAIEGQGILKELV